MAAVASLSSGVCVAGDGPGDRHASRDRRDNADRTELTLPAEPTENTDAKEPTEPIDRTDPTEPMLRIDPAEPIDKIDPVDPMLRSEFAELAGFGVLAGFPMSSLLPARRG
jgi:hypothetical protein